jgi:hypothetical protein
MRQGIAMSILEQSVAWAARAEPSKAADGAARGALQKEREQWSFLIWAFFIAQVLAAEQFIGKAAAAAAADSDASDRAAAADTVAAQAQLAPLAGLADAEPIAAASVVVVQEQADVVKGAFEGLDKLSDYADAEAPPAFARVQPMRASGSNGAADQAAGPGHPTGPALMSVTVGGDGVGQGLLPGIDLGGIVDGLVDPVLGSAGALLETLGDPLEQVTEPLSGALGSPGGHLGSIVADVLNGPVQIVPGDDCEADGPGDGGALGSIVASAGQIVFDAPPVEVDAHLDALFSSGGYTDYNLALRGPEGGDKGAAGSGDGIGSSTLLEHLLAGGDGHGPSQQDGQPVSLPGTLDDIALRGLGDGTSL